MYVPQVQDALIGPQGELGIQGVPGEQGVQGLQGRAGNTGAVGPVGPAGIQGPEGPEGAQGPQGVPGELGSDADLAALEAQHTADITALGNAMSDLIAQNVAISTQHSADLALLQSQIAELESTVTALEAVPSGFGELIHDSGWKAVGKGKDLTICTLEDPNIFVYMIGRNSYKSGHQEYYGGRTYDIHDDYISEGAVWFIEHQSSDWLDYPHTLKIHRFSNDSKYPEVRVLVWQLPPPETLLVELVPIEDDLIIIVP